MKINNSFAIVLLLCLFTITIFLYTDDKNKDIELPGLTIPSQDFKDLSDIVPDNTQFVLCSIEDDKCYSMLKNKLGDGDGS